MKGKINQHIVPNPINKSECFTEKLIVACRKSHLYDTNKKAALLFLVRKIVEMEIGINNYFTNLLFIFLQQYFKRN